MTDRGGHWPGRRVLVLGCTGFLGTWVVRGLLERGAEVVGLVRDPNRPSDFFRDKLHQHVHVVRGRADDLVRLRTALAACEIDTVFQFAAEPDGSAASYTHTALAAAGAVSVVVPLRPGVTVDHRSAGSVFDTTLVRLPVLFGGGDRRWDRWLPRLLLAKARGELLPVLPSDGTATPVGYVRDAIDAMLDALPTDPALGQTGFREIVVPPQGTGADLFAAASRLAPAGPRLHRGFGHDSRSADPLAEGVAEAVGWYRTAVLATAVPAPPPAHKAA